MKDSLINLILITSWICSSLAQSAREPILQCNFDDGLCDGWVHEEEEVYRWIVKTGAAKDFVGPRIDYTRQTRLGGYLYFDDGAVSGKAIIRTPPMDLRKPGKHCMRFVYFSRGTSPGELRIYHGNRGEFGRRISVFFKAGPLSKNNTHWIYEDISVPKFYSEESFEKSYFRIQALKGRGDDNVVAIDDFSVSPGPCPKFRLPRTATTAPPSVVESAQPGSNEGSVEGEPETFLTNEEVAARNAALELANIERNKKLEEMNALLNIRQTGSNISYSGLSEAEAQRRFQGEMKRLQEIEEQKQREEAERIAREKLEIEAAKRKQEEAQAARLKMQEEERLAKEAIAKEAEKRRKEKEDAERLKREEAERKAKEALERQVEAERRRKELLEQQKKERDEKARKIREMQEKQRQARLQKQKEEEAARKLEMDKRRERLEQEARVKADREQKRKELLEQKKREEEERLKKLREQELQRQKERQDGNQPHTQGNVQRKGDRQRNRQQQNTKAGDPDYEKCGKRHSHKTTQICCNGAIRKRYNEFTSCCGRRNYNPRRKLCCGAKVYSLDDTMGCCGSQTYNSDTQGCCEQNVFTLAESECVGGSIRPI